jgi:hypothetical protein
VVGIFWNVVGFFGREEAQVVRALLGTGEDRTDRNPDRKRTNAA